MNLIPLGAAMCLLATVCLGETSSPASFPLSDSPASFEQFATYALEHHPGLRAQRARVDAVRERIAQADTLPQPQLAVTVFGEEVQTRTGPQEQIVSLQQPFPWFGTLNQRENAASAQARAAEAALHSAELSLIRRLAMVVTDVAYHHKAIEFTGENLRLLQEMDPVVQARVEGGGEVNALLRLKVEIGRLSDRLEELRRNRDTRSAELRELLGLSADQALPVPEGTLSEFTIDGPQVLAPDHPELVALRAQRDAARSGVKLADLAAYPDLFVGASYIQVGDPVVNPTTPGAGEDPWNVTVGIRIPLWRGDIRAKKAEARSQLTATEMDIVQRGNELSALLEAALIGLRDAQRRLSLYGDELLGLARQAVDNSRTSYQANRISVLELIDSERTLLDLQVLYWRAAADAQRHVIQLKTLTLPSQSETP